MRYLIAFTALTYALGASAAPSADEARQQPSLGQPAKVVMQEDMVINGGEFDQYPILTDDDQFQKLDALTKKIQQRLAQGGNTSRPVATVALKNMLAYAQRVQQSRISTVDSLKYGIVSVPANSFVVLPEAIAPIKVAAVSNVPVIDGSIKASAYSENVTLYRKPGSLVLYNNSKKTSDVSLVNAGYAPPNATAPKPPTDNLSVSLHNKIGIMAANAATFFPGGLKVWPPYREAEIAVTPTSDRGLTVTYTEKIGTGKDAKSTTTKTTWYMSDVGWWGNAPDKHLDKLQDPRIADMAYQTVLGMVPSIQGSNKDESSEPYFHSATYTAGRPVEKGVLGVRFSKRDASGKVSSREQVFSVVSSEAMNKDIATTLDGVKAASTKMLQDFRDRVAQLGDKATDIYNKALPALQNKCSRACLTKMVVSMGGDSVVQKNVVNPLVDRYMPARLIHYAIKGAMSADQIADTVDGADSCIQSQSCKS